MKINYFQLLLIMISSTAFGQTLSSVKQTTSHTTEICSQHTRTQQMQIDDPERFATIGKRNNAPLQEHYTPAIQEKVTGIVYTIPVVFHVLHNNGSENISDAQIQDQLNILNRDFRRLNADANSVVTAFQGMPSDVEVEFKFATVAPDGSCFDGITRTQTSLTNSSNGQNQVNAVISGNNIYNGVWPHNKYLNVYIANDIGGAAGYTFLPNGNSSATAQNMYYNGIFLLHDYCGSIGTSAAFSSRALTHEVGHWLNLEHIWGGGNPGSTCGDDGIQDTPYTRGSTSCTLTANTCSNDNTYWGFNQIDNVENYMDYSYCSKMFTQGQVDEMRAALTSSIGGRSNIWTTSNLQLVGAIPGSSLCSIDFEANETVICAGTTVTYTPNTTTGISQYSWSFPGGNPTTSNLQSPTVTYNTPGNYNAVLTVTSSSNGLDYDETKTTYITVNNNTTVSLPINEGFTNAGTPAGWTIINTNSSGTWVRTTAAGLAPTAGNSFMFDNYNINDATDDEFQISKFSTVGMSSAQLTFDVAYAPYDANNYDGLEVLVSTDCGSTFTSVYSKINTVLATRSATTGTFTPTTAQWRGETIDLTPYVGESSVLVSFKNLAGYGNRLFVDNINITGVNSAPTADFNASSATACTSETVTFTDASVGATSWTWDFGAGATPPNATGAGPHDVTYASGGTKTISLTINGGSSSTENVVVTASPSTPTIIAGGATTFCSGNSVTLTSSSATGNQWNLNGSPIGGATAQTYSANATGNYTVTVTSGGCSSNPSAATSITVNPTPATPTINAGGAISFCSGGSVTLTSSSATGNQWNLNGNPIGGATAQTYSANATGNYTVTVTSGGCSSTSLATPVTVNPVPSTPTIDAGGAATTFCSGNSVTLTSSSATGNQWNLNGSPIGGATAQTYSANATGNYTVTVTSGGCSSNPSAATSITVNPTPATPTINAGGAISFCSGGSVTLTSSSATGNQWNLNGNPIGGATAQTYSANATGNYTVTVTSGGCSSTSLATPVTVNPIPSTPTIDAGGAATTFCSGNSVTLTSSSATGNQWNLNGSPIGGATAQTYSANATGNYTVTVTSGGCSSNPSAATSITVNPTPATPTINAGGAISFCSGGSVTLTSSSATGNQWNLNGNPIGGATAQTYSANATGNYTVTVTSGACSSTSLATPVTVTTTPPTPTIDAGGATTFCAGGSVTLTSTATSLNQWSLNGSPIGGANAQTYTASAAGNYTVTAGNPGCSSTSSPITVTINPLPTVSFGALSTMCVYNSPITLTQGSPAGGTYSGVGVSGGQFNPATAGNGIHTLTYSYTDGNNCTNSQNSNITVDGCLGIDEQDAGFISIFPNPSNGIFTLKSGNYNITSISVYNHLGQLVLDQKSNLNEQEINLTNFSYGIYTVRVNHEAGVENIRVILNK